MKQFFILMRRAIACLLFCLVASSGYSQKFNHPGMLHTNEDFERIKAQLAANDPAVVAGYNNLKNNEWAQSTVKTYPVDVIKRGVAGDENYINAARGAHAAYMNALRWKISGDAAHANRAVQILNAWASVTKDIGGNTNMSLASGIYGYEFANAAELMRDYAGWAAADFKKFQDWMLVVWYPRCYDFLNRRHDTWSQGTPGHYWSNWGLCNTLTMMSIGILCDDAFIYNQAVAYYKYDKVGTFKANAASLAYVDNYGLTEFIGNLVPVVHADARGALGYLGQMQESGRDQGHTNMAVGLAVDICQTAWNQGDDLFGYMDNRLLAGIEYVAAYNTGINDLPWTDYWYHDVRTAIHNSWKQTGPNADSRGQFRPFWARILGHYEGIKGIPLTYTHGMADKVVADGGGGGSTSGGYDHLGFSTLTSTRAPIQEGHGPLTLIATILYKGKTYQQGELNNVDSGSTLTLIPLLPEGVADNGSWLWNNRSSDKDLVVVADQSNLYRVQYTNENGAISTQLFSIAVFGDCKPDIYSYSITTEHGVVNDNTVTVKQNSKVIMSVASSSWHSSYLWDDGSKTATRTIQTGSNDTVYSLSATNMGGAKERLIFNINVEPLGASYKLADDEIVYDNKILIPAGKTLTLMPLVKSGLEGGSWLWGGGECTQNLVVENLQEDAEFSVVYTHNGKEYSLNFSVIIVPDDNSFAYYPMDEGSGKIIRDVWVGKHAQLNDAVWTNLGANGGAVKFDGSSSSYLSLPDNLQASLEDFSISVWVKPDALDTWARIWDFGNGTDYNMFLTGKAGDGYVRFAIKAGSSEQQITSSSVMAINKWLFIVVTKSGNTGRLYVNGVLVGTNSAMSIKPSDLGFTGQNYVGKSQYSADPLFKGTIDELRIYKSALNQSDIQRLMRSVKPFDAAYTIDNGELKYDSIVPFSPGQTITLKPVLKPGMNMIGGTWKWSDGSSSQNLVLENLQSPIQLWVSYTYQDIAYKQVYKALMARDVTSVYLKNPGFDVKCNYKQSTGSGVDLAPENGRVQAVEGWLRTQNGQWAAASTYEYGYLGTFNGVAIPSTGSDGALGNGSGALAISAGWGASVTYHQTLSLPAGEYNFEYKVINKNAATQGKSLAGWLPNAQDAVMSSKTSFGPTWESDVISFSLNESTTGKIQLGLQSGNTGSADYAKIFVDYVRLVTLEEETAIEPSTFSDATSGITVYPTVSSDGIYTIHIAGGRPAIISVFDLRGKALQQMVARAEKTELHLSDAGFYLIRANTAKGSEVFKVVKQ